MLNVVASISCAACPGVLSLVHHNMQSHVATLCTGSSANFKCPNGSLSISAQHHCQQRRQSLCQAHGLGIWMWPQCAQLLAEVLLRLLVKHRQHLARPLLLRSCAHCRCAVLKLRSNQPFQRLQPRQVSTCLNARLRLCDELPQKDAHAMRFSRLQTYAGGMNAAYLE